MCLDHPLCGIQKSLQNKKQKTNSPSKAELLLLNSQERSVIFFAQHQILYPAEYEHWLFAAQLNITVFVASMLFPSFSQITFSVYWTNVPNRGVPINKIKWYTCRLIWNIYFLLKFSSDLWRCLFLEIPGVSQLCKIAKNNRSFLLLFSIWGYTHEFDSKMGIWQNSQTNDFKLVGMFTLARCALTRLCDQHCCHLCDCARTGDVYNRGYMHESTAKLNTVLPLLFMETSKQMKGYKPFKVRADSVRCVPAKRIIN